MKIFVSVPMSGREDLEVMEEIDQMKTLFRERFPELDDVRFVNNLNCWIDPRHISVEPTHVPIRYLACAIEKMSYCDGVIFAEEYSKARGCVVEEKVAVEYGLDRYYIVDGSVYKVGGK